MRILARPTEAGREAKERGAKGEGNRQTDRGQREWERGCEAVCDAVRSIG